VPQIGKRILNPMMAIPSTPGYFATEDGRIYSSKTNKYIKLLPMKSGYLKFHAYYGKRGSMKNIYVHRAVCEAYHGIAPFGYEACHDDNNKLNNNESNLYWGTSKQNHKDKIKHGTDPKGERNPFAKLSNTDVIQIRKLCERGFTHSTIANMFGVYRTTIGRILGGKNWGHI
jgi:hypothetical protein